jgi:hydrogenase expression/formation protein HypE
VANEGRFIAFVKPSDAEAALKIMQSSNPEASLIGSVETNPSGVVTMKSTIGTNRVIDMLSGEQLPRIC